MLCWFSSSDLRTSKILILISKRQSFMSFIIAFVGIIIIACIYFPALSVIAGALIFVWIIGWKLSIFLTLLFFMLSKPRKFYKAWLINLTRGENPLRQHHLSGQHIDKFIVQDGIAIDTETGLTWCRFAHGQAWSNGEVVGEAKAVNWMTAFSVANRQKGYENYTDWRLPTCDELKTLVYSGTDMDRRCVGFNTDVFARARKSPFSDDPGGHFWSSTSDGKGYSKVFVFDYGSRDYSGRTGNCYYVRLVRGTLSDKLDFVDSKPNLENKQTA